MRLSFIQWFTGFFPALASRRIIFITLLALMPLPAAFASDMPAVVYIDQNGKEQWLDSKINKLTALHFWATWCKPCIEELPEVNAAQKKYKDSGFKIVAVSLDGKNIDKVKQFYQEHNIDSLEILLDPDMSAFRSLKIRGLPTTIFIDSNGKEIQRFEKPLGWASKEVEDIINSKISKPGQISPQGN